MSQHICVRDIDTTQLQIIHTNSGRYYYSIMYNILTTVRLTLSDPGYFRQLTIGGGGALKSPPPPPYDLENYCVNLHHIIHILPGVLGMFQLEFSKIRDFDHFTAISK